MIWASDSKVIFNVLLASLHCIQNVFSKVIKALAHSVLPNLRLKSDLRRVVTLLIADVPDAYVASLLSLSKDYVAQLTFQATVDRLYLTHSLKHQEYHKTQYQVHRNEKLPIGRTA